MQWDQIIKILFIATAVWQDIRTRSVALWIYIVFGFLAICVRIGYEYKGFRTWADMGISMCVGVFLYLINRATRGAIGEGDCMFFLVTGIFFSIWDNVSLLLLGLLLCSIYSLGLVVWGIFLNVNVRMKRLPFLPFLLIPGVWLVFL